MATRHQERRRSRRAAYRTEARHLAGRLGHADNGASAAVKLVAVGTWDGPAGAITGTAVSVIVRGRYEIRVVDGFASTTLVRLVRALEQV